MSVETRGQKPEARGQSDSAAAPRILKCPRLVVADTGTTFADSRGRVYDLETERTLTPKEAAGDPRLPGLSPKTIVRMINSGELYPVLRVNARVLRLFDCALTDWRVRAVASQPVVPVVVRRPPPMRATVAQSAVI